MLNRKEFENKMTSLQDSLHYRYYSNGVIDLLKLKDIKFHQYFPVWYFAALNLQDSISQETSKMNSLKELNFSKHQILHEERLLLGVILINEIKLY
jgi:hypothetical protein